MRRSFLVFFAGMTLFSAPGVSPALSAGFFESLFGPPPIPSPPPQPSYQLYPRRDFRPADRYRVVHKVHPALRRHKMVAALATPAKVTPSQPALEKCCASTDEAMRAISHDTTLKAGDLVMTERGLKKFVGSSVGFHKAGDFVAIQKTGSSDLDRFARAKFSLVAGGADPRSLTVFSNGHSNETLALRHLDDGAPRMVVDPRGRTLRFVGGYDSWKKPASGEQALDAEPVQ